MKKQTLHKITTTLAFMFFMLLEFKSFAQLPGDNSDNGDLDGDDPPLPTTIDSPKILILLLLGIIFMYFHFKKINAIKKMDV